MVNTKLMVQVIGFRNDKYTFEDGSEVVGTRYFSEFKEEDVTGVGTLDFFVNKSHIDFELLSKTKIPFYAIIYKQGKKWRFLQLSDGPK